MQHSATGATQLDVYADQLRAKLPAAPEGLKNGYVRWAPWIAIVFGALGVIGFLSLFVLGAALTPLMALGGAAAVRYGGAAMVGAIAGAATSALDLVGGCYMVSRRSLGWWIVALGLAISIITNVLSLAIVGLVISLLVAWIHLQVKPLYR